MEHVLYRKYRPRSFKDAVGQEHVTKTLQQALKSGRISHAYLFTGPRGVGKTSVARILAYEVNQLPYREDAAHLDIIEIDAASNRRIDEIRDLRDKVRTAPAAAKYKVYIIDEVHMLTREAFNALLKTLEEPPAHCIFILATTEAHKLPETIISRTQRFEFKPVSTAKVAEHLKSIAKKETIDITHEAINLLAEFGGGSFRDSIGYLDQLSSMSKIVDEEDVRQVLGLPSKTEIELIMSALYEANAKALIVSLQRAKEQGIGAPELAAAISKRIRGMLIEGTAGRGESRLLKQLIDVGASLQPFELLEILLLELITSKTKHQKTVAALAGKVETLPDPAGLEKSLKNPPDKKVNKPGNKISTSEAVFDLELWPQIVELSRSRAASLYTALRLAQPGITGDRLHLAFQFPLHKKKVEQAKNKDLISNLIEEVAGQKITIICEVNKNLRAKKNEVLVNSSTPVTQTSSINSISSIFGAAEMLEV